MELKFQRETGQTSLSSLCLFQVLYPCLFQVYENSGKPGNSGESGNFGKYLRGIEQRVYMLFLSFLSGESNMRTLVIFVTRQRFFYHYDVEPYHSHFYYYLLMSSLLELLVKIFKPNFLGDGVK